jgi:glycosyltransferase involved in cell wall biosynthesis
VWHLLKASALMTNRLIILIAPNVSEQMGGEAIKALQILREIKKLHPRTIQITHERCKSELSDRLGLEGIYYVNDTLLSVSLWKSKIFRALLDPWFCLKALRMAEQISAAEGMTGNSVIIHQTEPNSPVMPRFVSARHSNVFGPVNGNIYYPKIFRKNESLSASLRRTFHMKIQFVNRMFFHGLSWADAVLYAGGSRTRSSLEAGGCPSRILFDSVDCGVSDEILDRARITQAGTNLNFVHYGRLVFHKGTAIAIESLTKTTLPICLDIIGDGPEFDRCKELVSRLELQDRVKFKAWFPSHKDLINSLSKYRGVVLPSIEDANGLVVQEAMALGLPAVCLNWGGPQLLVENGISGYLIEPQSRESIISDIASGLDKLASDSTLAESFSVSAKNRAETWRWSKIAASWLTMYEAVHSPRFQ